MRKYIFDVQLPSSSDQDEVSYYFVPCTLCTFDFNSNIRTCCNNSAFVNLKGHKPLSFIFRILGIWKIQLSVDQAEAAEWKWKYELERSRNLQLHHTGGDAGLLVGCCPGNLPFHIFF